MKKLTLCILSLIFLLCATVGLVGCKEQHTHSFTEQKVEQQYLASAATCTESAKYYYSCSCGEKGTQTFTSGNALGHKFINYVSDNNATCTQDGTKTATCERNGCNEKDTITDTGTKLVHTFNKQVASEKYLASAATCTEEATYYYSCTCGEKGTQTFTSGNALGHSFTDYVPDGNATCTKDGTKTATCDHSGCNKKDTITNVGSAKGHAYSKEWSYSATEHWHASTCGHTTKSGRAKHTFANNVCTVCKYDRTIAVTSVSLNKTTLTLNVDDTETLSATILPSNATDKTIVWSSSNTSIATVNNGVVTAIAKGTATITAKCGNVLATCSVTVNEVILAQQITLSRTGGTINRGGSFTLTATILPINATHKSITWSSTDENIVVIDENGTFTAINYGTAYIIASVDQVWAQCVVTVKPDAKVTLSSGLSFELLSTYNSYYYKLVAYEGTSENVEVPATVDDIPVKVIDSAFCNQSFIKSITLPNTITKIGWRAFEGCRGLKKINIPDSCEEIDFFAFCYCSGLDSIYIPKSVKKINGCIFDGCKSYLKVYCEAKTIPSGWSSSWDIYGSEIVYGGQRQLRLTNITWGYKKETES